MLKTIRKWHKWPGIILTFFILIFALSGIILNHRELLSGIDIRRNWLPDNYTYKSWNLAAVKGSVQISKDTVLVYGNIGIWQTDSSFSGFQDYNKGFPEGIDNRKVSSVVRTHDGRLYAGTYFGLYRFSGNEWKKVQLPVKENRVVKILEKGDSLLVMTRSYLLLMRPGQSHIQVVSVPPPSDYDNQTGLFKTLWVIHSGEIYGTIGKLFIDFIGIVFILICITGLIYFFVPMFLKKIREESKSRIKRFNRDSLRVHNWFGSWLFPVLLLTTITGMFLRPPLLIPIANSRVDKIKYSELDDPNPWFDRFRDLLYDQEKKQFYFATGEGIYYADEKLGGYLTPFPVQPPVSVMGITSFEKQDSVVLVGSFSGIYRWDPESGIVHDHFTGMLYEDDGRTGPPFGNISVAGHIKAFGYEYIFDYAGGSIGLKDAPPFPQMPANVSKSSPISLWNTALEIHTGRIYEPLLGDFYILVVPLVGIFTLVILFSGFLSWYLARRRKRKPVMEKAIIENR